MPKSIHTYAWDDRGPLREGRELHEKPSKPPEKYPSSYDTSKLDLEVQTYATNVEQSKVKDQLLSRLPPPLRESALLPEAVQAANILMALAHDGHQFEIPEGDTLRLTESYIDLHHRIEQVIGVYARSLEHLGQSFGEIQRDPETASALGTVGSLAPTKETLDALLVLHREDPRLRTANIQKAQTALEKAVKTDRSSILFGDGESLFQKFSKLVVNPTSLVEQEKGILEFAAALARAVQTKLRSLEEDRNGKRAELDLKLEENSENIRQRFLEVRQSTVEWQRLFAGWDVDWIVKKCTRDDNSVDRKLLATYVRILTGKDLSLVGPTDQSRIKEELRVFFGDIEWLIVESTRGGKVDRAVLGARLRALAGKDLPPAGSDDPAKVTEEVRGILGTPKVPRDILHAIATARETVEVTKIASERGLSPDVLRILGELDAAASADAAKVEQARSRAVDVLFRDRQFSHDRVIALGKIFGRDLSRNYDELDKGLLRTAGADVAGVLGGLTPKAGVLDKIRAYRAGMKVAATKDETERRRLVDEAQRTLAADIPQAALAALETDDVAFLDGAGVPTPQHIADFAVKLGPGRAEPILKLIYGELSSSVSAALFGYFRDGGLLRNDADREEVLKKLFEGCTAFDVHAYGACRKIYEGVDRREKAQKLLTDLFSERFSKDTEAVLSLINHYPESVIRLSTKIDDRGQPYIDLSVLVPLVAFLTGKKENEIRTAIGDAVQGGGGDRDKPRAESEELRQYLRSLLGEVGSGTFMNFSKLITDERNPERKQLIERAEKAGFTTPEEQEAFFRLVVSSDIRNGRANYSLLLEIVTNPKTQEIDAELLKKLLSYVYGTPIDDATFDAIFAKYIEAKRIREGTDRGQMARALIEVGIPSDWSKPTLLQGLKDFFGDPARKELVKKIAGDLVHEDHWKGPPPVDEGDLGNKLSTLADRSHLFRFLTALYARDAATFGEVHALLWKGSPLYQADFLKRQTEIKEVFDIVERQPGIKGQLGNIGRGLWTRLGEAFRLGWGEGGDIRKGRFGELVINLFTMDDKVQDLLAERDKLLVQRKAYDGVLNDIGYYGRSLDRRDDDTRELLEMPVEQLFRDLQKRRLTTAQTFEVIDLLWSRYMAIDAALRGQSVPGSREQQGNYASFPEQMRARYIYVAWFYGDDLAKSILRNHRGQGYNPVEAARVAKPDVAPSLTFEQFWERVQVLSEDAGSRFRRQTGIRGAQPTVGYTNLLNAGLLKDAQLSPSAWVRVLQDLNTPPEVREKVYNAVRLALKSGDAESNQAAQNFLGMLQNQDQDVLRQLQEYSLLLTEEGLRQEHAHEYVKTGPRNISVLETVQNYLGTAWEMLRYGDFTDKAIAGAIFATIFLTLRSMYKKGWSGMGFLGRSLAVIGGVTIVDAFYEKMTGQGFVGRLGASFESERDRLSPAADFYRRMEIKSQQEIAAVRVLSEDNVDVLLTWYEKGYGDPSQDMPDGLSSKLGRIEITLEEEKRVRRVGKNIHRHRADIAYRVFGKFLQYYALQKNLSGGEQEAMDHIRKNFIEGGSLVIVPDHPELGRKELGVPQRQLTLPLLLGMIGPNNEVLKQLAAKDRTIPEMLVAATGQSLEWVEARIRDGWDITRILAFDKAPQLSESAADTAYRVRLWSGKVALPYLREFFREGGYELKEDALAFFETVVGMAKGVGLEVYRAAPGVIEFMWDAGASALDYSWERLKGFYDWLKVKQGISPILTGFEQFTVKIFGRTPQELLERPNVDFDRLALPVQWTADLRQLLAQSGSVEGVPEDDKVFEWLIDVGNSMLPAKNFKGHLDLLDVTAVDRMAIFEAVKRRVYSILLAHRIAKFANAPLDTGEMKDALYRRLQLEKVNVDWGTVKMRDGKISCADPEVNELAQHFDQVYVTALPINLLAREFTLHGRGEEYGKQRHPGILATPTLLLAYITRWVQYDHSLQYHERVRERVERMLGNAKKALGESSPEYKAYHAYVSTILTNATMEMALRDSPDRKPDDRTFEYTIEEAQDLLVHIQKIRGAIPEHKRLTPGILQHFVPRPPSVVPASVQRVLSDRDLLHYLSGRPAYPEAVSKAPDNLEGEVEGKSFTILKSRDIGLPVGKSVTLTIPKSGAVVEIPGVAGAASSREYLHPGTKLEVTRTKATECKLEWTSVSGSMTPDVPMGLVLKIGDKEVRFRDAHDPVALSVSIDPVVQTYRKDVSFQLTQEKTTLKVPEGVNWRFQVSREAAKKLDPRVPDSVPAVITVKVTRPSGSSNLIVELVGVAGVTPLSLPNLTLEFPEPPYGVRDLELKLEVANKVKAEIEGIADREWFDGDVISATPLPDGKLDIKELAGRPDATVSFPQLPGKPSVSITTKIRIARVVPSSGAASEFWIYDEDQFKKFGRIIGAVRGAGRVDVQLTPDVVIGVEKTTKQLDKAISVAVEYVGFDPSKDLEPTREYVVQLQNVGDGDVILVHEDAAGDVRHTFDFNGTGGVTPASNTTSLRFGRVDVAQGRIPFTPLKKGKYKLIIRKGAAPDNEVKYEINVSEPIGGIYGLRESEPYSFGSALTFEQAGKQYECKVATGSLVPPAAGLIFTANEVGQPKQLYKVKEVPPAALALASIVTGHKEGLAIDPVAPIFGRQLNTHEKLVRAADKLPVPPYAALKDQLKKVAASDFKPPLLLSFASFKNLIAEVAKPGAPASFTFNIELLNSDGTRLQWTEGGAKKNIDSIPLTLEKP